jgi:thiosulfate/3-mercaptopyruvate sulfurtransferase
MKTKILYTPNEVNDLISKGEVVVFDIRDVEDYQVEHLPGAVNVPDIFYYLSETTPAGLDALHKKFQELFSKAGLSSDKTAIVYEDCFDTRYGGSCRGYWLLSYLGHPNSGILDGGLKAWRDENLPLETKEFIPEPVEFTLNPQSQLIVTKDEMIKAIETQNIVLLDNRDKVEWIGESSSPYGVDFAPRKGRIPGAKWIEWYDFMDRTLATPGFKSTQDIQSLCAAQGIYPDDDIIIYCFKGARASNTYVALK